MKKILIVAVLSLVAMVSANAQIAPGMKYKELKTIYNPKEYIPESTDPYSRGWAGVGSFLIPGLGQVIDGEVGRGLIFFGANLAAFCVYSVNLTNFASVCTTDSAGNVTGYTDEAAAVRYSRNAVLALLGMGVIDIWSIVDAIKVAKVKNMYYQDLRRMRSSVDFDFAPFFTYAPTAITASGSSLTPTAGLSMRVSF